MRLSKQASKQARKPGRVRIRRRPRVFFCHPHHCRCPHCARPRCLDQWRLVPEGLGRSVGKVLTQPWLPQPLPEAIPYEAQAAGMSWDGESYPEMLDSIDRTPKGLHHELLRDRPVHGLLHGPGERPEAPGDPGRDGLEKAVPPGGETGRGLRVLGAEGREVLGAT